jgi:hypothetical protein
MAKATLLAATRYFDLPANSLSANRTSRFVVQVLCGYGVNRHLSYSDLFRALGFHLGSELLADQEFSVLDAFLRSRFPLLVQTLEQDSIRVDAVDIPAYVWIDCHTRVEAEHRDAAFVAIRNAMEFSQHVFDLEQSRELVLDGFRSFCELQAEFMEALYSHGAQPAAGSQRKCGVLDSRHV